MSTKPTPFQLDVSNALWVDVNSRFSVDAYPDRVTDGDAIIRSSLFNLFNCAPGQRGRTFQPTYGSQWLQFIHEPISNATAAKMEILMAQAIKKWEPRIDLDENASSVEADTSIPGYRVKIVFTMPNKATPSTLSFSVSQ